MMKRIMSLALIFLMIFGMVACGDTGSGSGTAAGNSAAASVPHEIKDTVNLALDAAIVTSDPMANTKDATMQTFQWVYESLVYADGNAEIHPRLATSWEVKNGGKDYVFQIRQGVKFHSGNPMTMEDVVFSYNRNCEMSFMKNYNGAIDSIEQTGDWELTIHLKTANNGFLYNLFNLKVVEKAIVEKEGDNFGNGAHLAGTGPYMYKSFEPNTLVVFERFEDYWGECGNIKTINTHIVTNTSTRVTALQTGELDFINVPTSSWEKIKNSGQYNILQQEGSKTCSFVTNWYREGSPLNDKRVRQALKYALDREAIIRVAADGLGKIAWTGSNPTYIIGTGNDFEGTFAYNPEKAKELLKEAGYPDGVQLGIFLVPNGGNNDSIAQMMVSMWEAVGIKITIEMAESATASTLAKEGYQDVYLTNSNYVHHESNSKRGRHSSTYKTQVAKYGSAELDSYYDNAEQALTDEDRDYWYKKMNEFVLDFAVNCPLYYADKTYAWDPNLDATIGTYYLYIQEWNWT